MPPLAMGETDIDEFDIPDRLLTREAFMKIVPFYQHVFTSLEACRCAFEAHIHAKDLGWPGAKE